MSQKSKEAETMLHLPEETKRVCDMSLQKKHFIKTASPLSISLSLSSKSVTTKALAIVHEVSHNQVSVSGRHHFFTEHWLKSKAQIMRSI